MNIWQPQWTDDNKINFNPSDTKYTRMKYFVLDLGRVYRKFTIDDRPQWYDSKSNLVFQDLELRFKFTFDRGIINKYFNKGIKFPYATALPVKETATSTIFFMQSGQRLSIGTGNLDEIQSHTDNDASNTIQIFNSASDLEIVVKPKYYIWQADERTNVYPQGLVQMSYNIALPSIMLWLPDLPEYKTINSVFSKMVDNSVITFQIWSMNGQYYANQKGIIRLPVYSLASAATAWNDLKIKVEGDRYAPKLYINEQQPNDWTQFIWRAVEDPRTWLREIENLPVPLPVNSRSHHNYSWSENGIKYISTGPSSKVSEEVPNKKSPWIVSLFNKLIKKDKKYE